MAEIKIGHLAPQDLPEATALCARAFRDSPSTIGMYGDDVLNRLRWGRRAFHGLLSMMTDPVPLAALYDGILLGMCGYSPPGKCFASLVEAMREAPAAHDEEEEERGLRRWLFAVADHDLAEPHVHVGPVAVEVDVQGMRIGSRMLEILCARLDEAGDVGWLETDKPQNVRLYERFGFEVTDDVTVNGHANWFMRRAPLSR